ncbi:TPA: hypothetical protein DIC20_01080 [Candidatus Dependentiae bacterium]|nr:MAG: hypothetical protein US03_C0002G0175 [candidate division TM6 bacterium GW2011_GWF2_36_131]KKQ03608.1 MAG: hypothetical protein US13_C0002G0174 [candidate division TM6 bacterium GW2011_GWE2_36_25]KKQ20115.1 MAG: hypothetical protein US32_C0001G0012 [candidate division TM6 bacterium GW2011_GWA2_36_9]HBR70658.1 hypothetical protein [Candidatus Dependentiae bacterium]HCU00278.1 hypothetical protein [Candidatus Dependentiae bacterium]
MKYIVIILLLIAGIENNILAKEVAFTNKSEQIYLITNEGRTERIKGITRPGWNITKINPFGASSIHFEMRRCGKKDGKENQYYVFKSPNIPLNFTQATISGRWPTEASQGASLLLTTENGSISVPMNQASFTEQDCRSLVY